MIRSLITPALVSDLIARQFPQWSNLPVTQVLPGGIDNRTFRLGDDLLVRLPSASCYVNNILKEYTWLPFLAPYISLAIPHPMALGKPSDLFPYHWSVYRWIKGDIADSLAQDAYDDCATKLASFLKELHVIPTTNASQPSLTNFYRGGNLSHYDKETGAALENLKPYINCEKARTIWNTALQSHWSNPGVWIHGDLSSHNILVKNSEITGIIDFSCMAVGDPACDLVIAWTFFNPTARKVFRSHLQIDSDTWSRARGWCLWKSLITLDALDNKSGPQAQTLLLIIEELFKESSTNTQDT